MKYLLLFVFAMLSQIMVKAQPQASSCTTTSTIAATYTNDVAILTVARLNSINAGFKDSIEIPAIYADSISKALYAIHNMPASALKDTIMNLFGFSNFNATPSAATIYEIDSCHIIRSGNLFSGYSMKRIAVNVLPTSAIAASWIAGNYNTTPNTALNNLLNKYGLTVSFYADYGTYRVYNIQCPKPYNTKALAKALFNTTAFSYAEPQPYIGDGNYITVNFETDGIKLDYRNGCGDCPSWCTYGSNWYFKVAYANCSVNYLGASRELGFLPTTTCTRGSVIMPSLFSSLQGYVNGNMHTLEWTTTATANLQQFVIEQSKDGVNFNIVGNIAAVLSNSNKWNAFAADHTTSFYRIKAIAKDGYSVYSNLIKINVSTKSLIQLYPNPVVNNAVHVTYNKLEQGRYSIELFDQNVRAVFKQSILINNTSGSTLIQLPAAMQKGNYLVVIKNSNSVVLKQFINIQ